ncbi:fungal-specific transcription factor domain-containing protein [Xylariales sp. AK1849]|nr:fungal-specific transcription factor domain-containing protein [Xylariales sp. AK1849]
MKRGTSNADEDQAEIEPSPAPKRQRVSRACDQCRAAREKCDGIQPLCFPCASQNRQCSWEEPKKKRGVQTGYIRTLELALGWIFDKIPGSEEALHGLLTHEGGQGRTLLVGKDTGAGNRLHRRWRKSTVHKEIDRVLSGGSAATQAEKPSPAVDESDSGDEPDLMENFVLPTAQASKPALGISESNAPERSEQPLDFRQHRPRLKTLRLPPNCWRLLDIYFSYTHCWFPVLEKALVHKTCWSYPAEGLKLTDDDPGSACHAELWAALALASYQDEASQQDSAQGSMEGRMAPDEIYRAARSMIPLENNRFEPRRVNALLLLSLVNIGRRELTAAWILIGSATRITLSLGLHLGSTTEGCRRPHHTYLACFILDTLVSARLNRPPHLRSDDIQLAMPTGEDDQDEWDAWMPCPGFGHPPPQATSSRSPAHSITSFASFYGIHRIHSNIVFNRNHGLHREEPYLTQIQRMLSSSSSVRRPFSTFIINGGVPTTQLPSVHLLRLAYLCCGSQTQVFSDSLPSTVLQCVEEHILNFGISAIPPLFSIYLALVGQQCNLDLVKAEVRDRWKKVEAAIDFVWSSCESRSISDTIHGPPDRVFSYPQSSSNAPYPSTPNTHATITHLSTPSSHYADTPTDQPHTLVNDIYRETSIPTPANFPTSACPRPLSYGSHPNLNTYSATGSDLPDMQHYPAHARPSFSSATFDYDAILDDIASLDRADRMGSDPQFMANLGFAPGSDLTELLTHDYQGIS